ncbi:MAG: hypothetical protein HN729_08920 [Candidatus Marinimicrobia bacterium]|jgi:uridine kinase|nr:hypothetical protein [Candidatus Neomarinimicrobiota bacterium]MBT3683613.1 hypothetical protein [Candidatus Neomarinimicrobiota bacterium]MBT3760392.1 hypothetical protein [Candidatus Neomarinimicrobiota bacterium]MBT3896530.1 hypothetical protein [Candidatus Neomarinimicrobiota bacterium]MBT4173556.1 hypothetical protein [Candidatus Neomarinimicrobiota bacterium]
MTISKKLISTIKMLKVPAIIAVSGFGGAGKSTFTKALSNEVDLPIIGVDSFFRGFDIKNYSKWECFDFARLEKDICLPFLKGNKQIKYRDFDWVNNSTGNMKKFSHSGIIIIEGVGLFRPELINYFSYMIWIDCPIEEAIKRGKQRDLALNITSHDQYWDGIWRRNDEEYWTIYKPKEIANDIIKT